MQLTLLQWRRRSQCLRFTKEVATKLSPEKTDYKVINARAFTSHQAPYMLILRGMQQLVDADLTTLSSLFQGSGFHLAGHNIKSGHWIALLRPSGHIKIAKLRDGVYPR